MGGKEEVSSRRGVVTPDSVSDILEIAQGNANITCVQLIFSLQASFFLLGNKVTPRPPFWVWQYLLDVFVCIKKIILITYTLEPVFRLGFQTITYILRIVYNKLYKFC